ncbi:MAG TPA: TetR/AcrR family transcriptional regulator [Burkholderiales bacterium]|nr:TetR/AcrR family transcriptional regulator [Burkholderiales bacterium]
MSTSGQKKPPYHHGDLRSALLRAAGEILEKQGPEGIVLREVARRAGVSHNAPYRHFPSRDALLAALAAEGFAEFGARMQSQAGAVMGEAYVSFALERPQRFRLMFGGTVKLGSDPALARAASGAYEGLVAAFRARGDVADPETAAAAAWSLVHGLSHLLLAGHFPQATAGGAQRAEFIRKVTGAVRFAAAPQRTA